MALTLVTGPANSAKAQIVLDGYRAALARSPILVVPRAADAEHYRRELAGDGLVLGVRVEPFSSLMREIASRAGLVAAPLRDHARDAVLAAVLRSAKLEVLAGAAQGPTFVHALARFISELESRRITPGRFTAALRSWAREGTSRRAYVEELAALYSAYQRRLERLGRPDETSHAVAALDALALAPDRWGGTPVFCYGFDDLDALQLDAIETLAHRVGAPLMLSLPGEPGRVALAGRAATLERLRPAADRVIELAARSDYYEDPALFQLERALFEDTAPRAPSPAVRLLEGGDERAEAELIAAEVAALIAGGLAPGDIAIVTRTAGRASELLAEVLATFELPYNATRRGRFASSTLGRGLLALLRCAAPGGQAADLVSWLRVRGVVRLEDAVDRFEAELLREGTSDLESARSRWEAVHGRLNALQALQRSAPAGGVALLERVERELAYLFEAPHERAAALLDPWEAAAFAAALSVLCQLRELAGSQPRLLGGIAGVVRALEDLSVELPANAEGDAVLICDALSLRARRVRALFICQAQEGMFPAPAQEELFLGAGERAALAQATGLVLDGAEDWLATERYLFYALASRPSAKLFVSWHAATDDGEAALASLFVDELLDCFEDGWYSSRRTRAAGAIAWVDGSPDVALLRDLEQLLAAPRKIGAVIAPLAHPGRLSALRGHAEYSPSALERWAGCPVAWFVGRALGVKELGLDSHYIVAGAVAHDALAGIFGRLAEDAASGRLDSGTLSLAFELLDAALAEDRRKLSGSPEADRTQHYRLRSDLRRFLALAARRGGEFVPWQLELPFGLDEVGSRPAAALAGGELALCGRIDRIDLDPTTRRVVVYDYKGAARTDYGGAAWAQNRRLQPALYMRAAEALLDVEAVGGLYQPLRGGDPRPRGALRGDVDAGSDVVAGDRFDAAELEALIDAQVAVAVAAAREIDQGALEPRPATCANNKRCLYPTICRCEAR
jgi:ATP-dependent helicase/DNAse subunit B